MDSESSNGHKAAVSMSLISEPEEGEIFDVSYNPIERPVVEANCEVIKSGESVTCQDNNITSSNGTKGYRAESSGTSASSSEDEDETSRSSSISSSDGSSRVKNSKRFKMEPHKSTAVATAASAVSAAASTAMEIDDVVPAKSKNRNIWTTIATEDSLNNSLVNCDVGETFDRSRNVEAYDYRLSYSYRQQATENKSSSGEESTRNGESVIATAATAATAATDSTASLATTSDVSHTNSRKTKRNQKRKLAQGSHKPNNMFGRRKLPKLEKGVEASVDELAAEIATNLTESKSTLIGHVVRIAGHKTAIDLYEKVCAIELDGGMSKEFGRKRRTSGGVFFLLVKNDDSLTAEQKKEIFSEDQTINMKAKRKRRRKRELDLQQQQEQENNGEETKAENAQNTADVVMKNDSNGEDQLLLTPPTLTSAIEDKTLDLDCDTDAALTKDIVLD